MHKILVVLTGGTICSAYEGDVKHLSDTAGLILCDNFQKSNSTFAGKVKLVPTKNFGIFSENMTVNKWNELLSFFRHSPAFSSTAFVHGCIIKKPDNFDEEQVYDGIIILHGTDSLAYSAALFSFLLQGLGVPVFLVSSNDAPASPKANGNDNFRTAVECICSGILPNVYVSYRNISDGQMYLHLASRLTQCPNYSEDFQSVGMVKLTAWNKVKIPFFFGNTFSQTNTVPSLFDDFELSDCVLRIEPYVGLNYAHLNLSGVKAILHGTYHSGTVCAEQTEDNPNYSEHSILSLIDRCNGQKIYIAPSKLEGKIYDTVPIVANHKPENNPVRFVYGMTNEMLYAKLLIAYSLNLPDPDSFIDTECSGEYFYKNRTADVKQPFWYRMSLKVLRFNQARKKMRKHF